MLLSLVPSSAKLSIEHRCLMSVSAAKPPGPDRANHQQTNSLACPAFPSSWSSPSLPGSRSMLGRWKRRTDQVAVRHRRLYFNSFMLVNGNPSFLLVVAPLLSPFSNLRNGLKLAASLFSGFFRLPIVPIFVVYIHNIHIYLHLFRVSSHQFPVLISLEQRAMASVAQTTVSTSHNVHPPASASWMAKNGTTAAPPLADGNRNESGNRAQHTNSNPRAAKSKYRHVAAFHSRPRVSCLSRDSETSPSFMGFRNLMVLVLSKYIIILDRSGLYFQLLI